MTKFIESGVTIAELNPVDKLTLLLGFNPGRGMRQAFPGEGTIGSQLDESARFIADELDLGDVLSAEAPLLREENGISIEEARVQLANQLGRLGIDEQVFIGWMILKGENTA